MAHQMIKPYSLLFYLLAFICSFFIGIVIAGLVEAGKGQMLAGGAIVLGYGVITAVIGFVISLFITLKTNRKLIFRGNIILAILILSFWGYFYIKYQNKQKIKAQEKQKTEQPKQQTAPGVDKTSAFLYPEKKNLQPIKQMGLGMFSPYVYANKALYFYGNLNIEKSLTDHYPTDSISFKQVENGGFDIATAPPWLVPQHLKLDYDILHFKAISVTEEFIEIEVNKLTNETAFVSKSSGKIMYWPEFLLSINSVEFLNNDNQNVYIKPLNNAGIVKQSFSFMRPLKINQNWMYVLLLTDNLDRVGNGWIKWNEHGELIIAYSLLS
jgi:hypothetical protein